MICPNIYISNKILAWITAQIFNKTEHEVPVPPTVEEEKGLFSKAVIAKRKERMRDYPRRKYVRKIPRELSLLKPRTLPIARKDLSLMENAGELPKIILKIPAKTEIDVPMQPTEHITRVLTRPLPNGGSATLIVCTNNAQLQSLSDAELFRSVKPNFYKQ